MRYVVFLLCFIPLGCGSQLPILENTVSAEAQNAPFPNLVALGPLLAQVDAPLIRSADGDGRSLDARAADLRRRADQLRQTPL